MSLNRIEIQRLAMFSSEAYDDVPARDIANRPLGSPASGFILLYEETSSFIDFGLSAASYYNPTTGSVAIAFGGTEVGNYLNFQDFFSDLQLVLFNNAIQQAFVSGFVETSMQWANANVAYGGASISEIVYTGHSLGGYLAQYAELTDTTSISRAVVFNSTGYPSETEIADVTYIYTDPRQWGFGHLVHNLDNRISSDVYYVLDENGNYGGFAGGHSLPNLTAAINSGLDFVSEAELIQMIVTEINAALPGPAPSPIQDFRALMEVQNRYLDLPFEVRDEATRQSNMLDNCYPAGTSITLADGSTKPIEQITITDQVLTFDANGNATVGIVDKTFTNTTAEFAVLSFADEREDLTLTPGHRVLTETGDYMEIGHMLRLGGGHVRLTDSQGNIVEATGQIVAYSAETADMFPVSATKTIAFEGNAVLKHDVEAGWQTYNFEVREHHNYVAQDIRVHNDSILATLEEGDTLVALNDTLTNAAVLRDVNGDGTDDFVTLDGYHRAGEATDIALTRVYYWNSTNGDLAALLAAVVAHNPVAASHVFDPTLGNNWNDGSWGDDIEEAFFDDVYTGAGATGDGTVRSVIDGLYSATFFAGVDISSLASAGDVIASQELLNAIEAAAVTPTDAAEITAWLLGVEVGSIAYIAMVAVLGSVFDNVVNTITGTSADDTLTGTQYVDDISGGDGDDLIRGKDGDDTLNGDAGNDTLIGGAGADTLNGGGGVDTASYADATAFVRLNMRLVENQGYKGDATGDDLTSIENIIASGFNDYVYGDDNDNVINGGAGNDLLRGHNGNDTLIGGDGADNLRGGGGNDALDGGAGDDFIFGGAGDDILNGQLGADTLDGGAGDDWLNGGWGWDIMIGGSGADRFYHHGTSENFGTEWVNDFSNTEGDRLVLGSSSNGAESDFFVTFETVAGHGSDAVAEAFVHYIPFGTVAWIIEDGADLNEIMIQTNTGFFDLLG